MKKVDKVDDNARTLGVTRTHEDDGYALSNRQTGVAHVVVLTNQV